MLNLKIVGFNQYAISSEGKVYSLRSSKFLSENKRAGNYIAATLSQEGERQEFTNHRLTALAYLTDNKEGKTVKGISVDYLVVNHIDTNTLNNDVSNLEWVTQKENVAHSVRLGNYKTINSYRPITDEVAHGICKLLEQGSRIKDITNLFDVTQVTVSSIKNGTNYQDISEEYSFTNIPSKNRISESKVILICNLLQQGVSINRTRLQVNVGHGTVKSIKSRKSYQYISVNYIW